MVPSQAYKPGYAGAVIAVITQFPGDNECQVNDTIKGHDG